MRGGNGWGEGMGGVREMGWGEGMGGVREMGWGEGMGGVSGRNGWGEWTEWGGVRGGNG